jgi:hypothetical protein
MLTTIISLFYQREAVLALALNNFTTPHLERGGDLVPLFLGRPLHLSKFFSLPDLIDR